MGMSMGGFARLGRDAELRYTSTGSPVASLWLAYDHGRKKEDGNRETQWMAASMYGEAAEKLVPYLTKGTAVHIVCRDPHIEVRDDGKPRLTGVVLHIELAPRQRDDGDHPHPEKREHTGRQAIPDIAGMDEDIPF